MPAAPERIPAWSTPVLQPGETLRTMLRSREQRGEMFNLDEAIAMVVPLCLDLKARHKRGERLHVHPSCIVAGPDGLARIEASLAHVPNDPRDRACVAPENQQSLEPGDARASVYSLGALLYESLTGHIVGPGMPRPTQVNPTLPASLENLIAKALIGDRARRPDDLGALASAMHHIAPMKSIPPPMADESHLDHTGEYEVDIRLSMIPPSEAIEVAVPHAPQMPRDPFAAIARPSTPNLNDPTVRLGALKDRLEADPRPRYVVHKDRMDHGPFSAVELLQQITSHVFTSDDVLRDEISGQSHAIKEWEEFAPFAEQASIKREIVAEKKAVAIVEKSEKRAGIAKTVVGFLLVLGIVGGGLVWFLKFRGSRNDNIAVKDDTNSLELDVNGRVKGGGKRATGGGGGGGGGGGFPAGMGYEQAMNSNVQEINMGQKSGPDLTNAQLEGPLKASGGSFLAECGTPGSMKVAIHVAVKHGRAAGVTVATSPTDGKVASCIDRKVRGLGWPSNPKMDGVHISF